MPDVNRRRSAVQRRLRALDERRRALLADVEALSAERLTAKPLPGKWSILEIVEHLVLAERAVLQNLPEPSQLVGRPRGLKARVSYPMVLFVLKYGIPVEVPSPRMVPTGRASLPDLRRAWDESQQWLRSYVDGLDRRGLARAVFAHPVAGPLTPAQAIRLGRVHLETHARQIGRLVALTS
jgi:DinB superfamily